MFNSKKQIAVLMLACLLSPLAFSFPVAVPTYSASSKSIDLYYQLEGNTIYVDMLCNGEPVGKTGKLSPNAKMNDRGEFPNLSKSVLLPGFHCNGMRYPATRVKLTLSPNDNGLVASVSSVDEITEAALLTNSHQPRLLLSNYVLGLSGLE